MIKASVEVKKLTLPVFGRKMTFTEEELIAFVEKCLLPKAGKWIKVYPKTINWKLFEEERRDMGESELQKIILGAKDKMEWESTKYLDPFEIMIPEGDWTTLKRNASELEMVAKDFGGKMADLTQLGLAFAQRITDGEPWKNVFWDSDNTKNGILLKVEYPYYDAFELISVDARGILNISEKAYKHGKEFCAVAPVVVLKLNARH